jgi:ribonuclease E
LIEQEARANDENLEQTLDNNEEERKSRSRSPRRDEASLEKVTVEMNDLEQEIYALMGISPLVYADRAATEPKSVLVYVKKPGEELVEDLDTATTNGTIEQLKSSKKLKTRGRKPKVKVESESEVIEEPEVLTVAEAEEVEAIVEYATEEPEATAKLATVEPDTEEPDTEESNGKNGRRRRRRRSSAT